MAVVRVAHGPRGGGARREVHLGGEIRRWGGRVGERHRVDEVLLEARLDGRLDLLHGPRDPLDLAPGLAREQRDQRPGARGVAGGADAVEWRVGYEPEDQRVERRDLAPERAGELDAIDRLDPEVVHEESRSRVERGLR